MNWVLHCLAAVLVLNVASATFNNNKPFAFLPEYRAYGFRNTTRKGTTASLFLGLPYAQPPTGFLRFEKTVPLFPNLLKSVQATQWPKACHQVVDATSMGIISDEDCLYLNVMTPANKSSNLLPVFIFIHGGGYEYGETKEYGWEYFVDNFVAQDVIMVTLTYRLAHFGFLATEDGVINGNFGHFDQVEALKFIKRNIRAFGGDPNRITLGGHSAGGGSVHSISLSHYSTGLFNQEVRLAGSNYAGYAMNNRNVLAHSKLISDTMGCTQQNSYLRKLCLKSKPYTAFWEARNVAGVTDFPLDNLDIVYWTTVFDNDFFAGKNLSTLAKEAPKRKTLYGVDAGEGLLFSLYGPNPITNVFSFGGRGFSPDNRTLCTPQWLHDTLHQQLFYYSDFTAAQETEILNRLFEFYQIGDEFGAGDPLYHWNKYTDLYSDMVFKVPKSQEVRYKIANGFDNQYMYVFNYTRPIDVPTSGHLPGHGGFLLWFAGLEIYTNNGLTFTPTDDLVQANIRDVFVSFIKTGVPATGGVTGPKVTPTSMPYLEIGTNVIIDDVDFKPKADFWDQLQRDFNYNFFKGLPLDQTAHM